MDKVFSMLAQQKKSDMMRSIDYLLKELYQLVQDNLEDRDKWCLAKYNESIGKGRNGN